MPPDDPHHAHHAHHPGAAPPAELTEPIARIDAQLRAVLETLDLTPALRDAMAYALLGPGKRVRPVLAWHAAGAVVGEEHRERARRAALPAAAAVEMVHAFSLVHDDLPALDDDDLRRGRPTLHKYAGEAMAVLAGDCLLSGSFQSLAVPAGGEAPPPELVSGLAGELASATTAMIVGQVHDTLGGLPEGLDDRARLELVHRQKTGALLRSACRMGARCGLWAAGVEGAVAACRLEAVSRYAEAVGLMFQVVDDLLDVEQSAETTGKRTGKDAGAGKLTYPGVLGVDGSRAEVSRLEAEALAALDGLAQEDGGADALRGLVAYLARRTR